MANVLSSSVLAVPNGTTTPHIISFDSIDPVVAGMPAPRGSLGLRTDTGAVYAKVGVDDRAWAPLGNLASVLAAIATTGSANDLVSGTIPAARMPALVGDVISAAGTVATTIANGAVTDVKLRDSAATSVIGRSAGMAGTPGDIIASADGQILRRAGGTLSFGPVSGTEHFGDGSDGELTISTNAILDRDMFYDRLTVAAGVTLDTAGFRVFAKTAIVLDGRIVRNGNSGGATGGGALTPQTLAGSAAGGPGGTTAGTAGPGASLAVRVPRGYTAAGGKGGNGNGQTGASGGGPGSALQEAFGDIRLAHCAMLAGAFGVNTGWTTFNRVGPGGGGGGGGGAFGQQGGGGGSGGGYVVVCAAAIAGSGTLEAKGGDGGDAQNAPGASTGGGGGGGGGIIVIVTSGPLPAAVVLGGRGGLGRNGGTNGAAGTDGLVLRFNA